MPSLVSYTSVPFTSRVEVKLILCVILLITVDEFSVTVVMAAFSDVDAPDFGLAPVGADLQDDKPEAPAPHLDLSGLSVAPVGSDMGQAKAEPAPPAPDTSHLKVL